MGKELEGYGPQGNGRSLLLLIPQPLQRQAVPVIEPLAPRGLFGPYPPKDGQDLRIPLPIPWLVHHIPLPARLAAHFDGMQHATPIVSWIALDSPRAAMLLRYGRKTPRREVAIINGCPVGSVAVLMMRSPPWTRLGDPPRAQWGSWRFSCLGRRPGRWPVPASRPLRCRSARCRRRASAGRASRRR